MAFNESNGLGWVRLEPRRSFLHLSAIMVWLGGGPLLTKSIPGVIGWIGRMIFDPGFRAYSLKYTIEKEGEVWSLNRIGWKL